MSKKKDWIEFVCKDCGHVQQPKKEKSNKNWNVINPNCDKCGGKLNPELLKE